MHLHCPAMFVKLWANATGALQTNNTRFRKQKARCLTLCMFWDSHCFAEGFDVKAEGFEGECNFRSFCYSVSYGSAKDDMFELAKNDRIASRLLDKAINRLQQ